MQELGQKQVCAGGGGEIPNENVGKPSYMVVEASETLENWLDVGSCTLQPCK